MRNVRNTRSRRSYNAPPSQPTSLLMVLLVSAVAASGFLFWLFGGKSSNSEPKKLTPLNVLVGVDVSRSVSDTSREHYFEALEQAVNEALPREPAMTFWVY